MSQETPTSIGDDKKVSFIKADSPDNEGSELSKEEDNMFQAEHDEKLHKNHPNSVMLPFGRSFISWHSENGVAVLALIVLIVLCISAIFTELFAVFTPNKIWAEEFLKLLGQGIIGTAGALIGSGTTTISSNNKNK